MAKKKTKAEKIAEVPITELIKKSGKDGTKELQSYLRTLRTGYQRRVGVFRRKGLFSYAQYAFEESFPDNIKGKKITELNHNQLVLEIARYSKFFNDQTSSEAGIRKVNREQDARIFGTDDLGNPLQQMTQQEREDYWDLYEDFKKVAPQFAVPNQSTDTQQFLADAFFNDEEFNKLLLAERLNYLKVKLQERQAKLNLEGVPDVLSGRGPRLTSRFSTKGRRYKKKY